MRLRVLWLSVSALLIAAACLYKVTRTYDRAQADGRMRRCVAPAFPAPLLNQHLQPRRLKAFLGRRRILIVFYDGEKGAEADGVLVRLRDDYDRLKANRVIVLGISTATPQQNRPPPKGIAFRHPNSPETPFPFDLLTDLPLRESGPKHRVHRQWGRLDSTNGRTRPGVFLIARDQTVACDGGKPVPVEDADAAIDELLKN
ncbi:MAG: redoxin domain-containing protein [Planctomycetaceae bacterium]